MLRPGLLDGLNVCLAGGGRALGGRDPISAIASLGCTFTAFAEDGAVDCDALVYDAAAPFAAGGLRGLLDDVWVPVEAVVNRCFIPNERAGKIVLVAPSAGEHAGAAADALENLARTLSIEWARFGITVTAVAPAAQTDPDRLATVVAFLLSRAGDYYTGCRLALTA